MYEYIHSYTPHQINHKHHNDISTALYTAKKKGFKKGFHKGFFGGKGFTTLQKTLACYHRGFLGKRFFKGFSVSYFNSDIISLMVHLYALQPTTWGQL